MTHWPLVSSPLNFETSQLGGFDVAGMKTRWRKAALEVQPGETYPHRFPIELVKARDKDDYLPVESFLDDYEKAKKWPAKNWTLAFQGNVHRLNDHDYQLIHDLL